MSLLTPFHRAWHILGFLRSFLATVKLPDGATIIAMERHATALATADDLKALEDMVHGNEATRELVRDRWMPERYTLEDLERFRPGTLGYEYRRHMMMNGLDVDFFPDIKPDRIDEFMRIRLYQTHDIIHVMAGYGTSFEEEMGLVGFYLAQYLHKLPHRGELVGAFMGILTAGVVLHGSVTDTSRLRDFLDLLTAGYRRGLVAKCVIGPRWEEFFDRPVDDLRREFGIPPRELQDAAKAVA